MRVRQRGAWAARCALAAGLLAGCREAPSPRPPPTTPRPLPYATRAGNPLSGLPARAQAAFAPVEATLTPGEGDSLVELGRMLFSDPRLGRGERSCAGCHPVDGWGASSGGARDAPSVYNAALRPSLYWDGRASDVEDQIRMALVNTEEMAQPDEAAAARAIAAIPGYAPFFVASFGSDDVTPDRMISAIAAFERRLTTPGPLDRYLMDDLDALTHEQALGMSMFIDAGCVTCHNGPTLGKGQQRLGVVEPYPTADMGVFAVSQRESDRGVFAVPGLRNVANTGPWLHDGSIKTLHEVVSLMGRYQLGRELDPEQTTSIVAFLGALTGERPGRLAGAPLTLP